MKKLFSIILCGIILLGCCSCAGKTSGQSSAAAKSGTAAADASATTSASSANTTKSDLLESENHYRIAGYTMDVPNWKLGWQAWGDKEYYSQKLKKSNEMTVNDMFLCADGCVIKDDQVKTCSNLDGAIEACLVDMREQISAHTGNLYDAGEEFKQTVETKKQVKVNSYDMLKVTGKFNDSHKNVSSYYVAYYAVVPADKNVNEPHPIYWVLFSGSKDNVPTLEKYADAMAQSFQKEAEE